MPRLPPSQVIEHRVSLSNSERQALQKYITYNQHKSYITSAGTVLAGAGVVGVGFGVYYGAKYLGTVWSTIEDAFQSVQDAWNETTTEVREEQEKNREKYTPANVLNPFWWLDKGLSKII